MGFFKKKPDDVFRDTPEYKLLMEGRITSLVAKDAEFNGNIKLKAGAKIDGQFNGDIRADEAWVVVMGGAQVTGNIIAQRVILYGKVKGHVVAERILLGPESSIHGDLTYSIVRMAEGAEVDGMMRKQAELKATDVRDTFDVVAMVANSRTMEMPAARKVG